MYTIRTPEIFKKGLRSDLRCASVLPMNRNGNGGLSLGDLACIALVTGHGAAVTTLGLWGLFFALAISILVGMCWVLWRVLRVLPDAVESLSDRCDRGMAALHKWIPILFNRSVDALAHVLSL